MKIIVFGTGNYVTGRGTNQFGTILPAIFEFQKKNHTINEVVLVATNNTSKLMAKNKLKNIMHQKSTNLKKYKQYCLKINYLKTLHFYYVLKLILVGLHQLHQYLQGIKLKV